VDAALGTQSGTTVITELFVDTNHRFIPLTALSIADAAIDKELVDLHVKKSIRIEQQELEALEEASEEEPRRGSIIGRMSAVFRGSRISQSTPQRATQRLSMKEIYNMADEEQAEENDEVIDREATEYKENPMDLEFYRQPRYACGQLFVGNVVNSLAANALFNPSLTTLVKAMISARVSMVQVPRDFVKKSYVEFVEHILHSKELLACGIYRKGEYKPPRAKHLKQARREAVLFGDDDDESPTRKLDDDEDNKTYINYVYTAPPGQDTILQESDRIMCFSLSAIEVARREKEAAEAEAKAKSNLLRRIGAADDSPKAFNMLENQKKDHRSSENSRLSIEDGDRLLGSTN
jgi:hypothetical protein